MVFARRNPSTPSSKSAQAGNHRLIGGKFQLFRGGGGERGGAVSARFRIPSHDGEFPSRIRRLKPANSVRVAVKPETSRVQRRFSSLTGAFPRSSNSSFLNSLARAGLGTLGRKKEEREKK